MQINVLNRSENTINKSKSYSVKSAVLDGDLLVNIIPGQTQECLYG